MTDVDVDVVTHAVAHSAVRLQIFNCTSCSLREETTHDPIPFYGSSPNSMMMVGEAPGPIEDKYGRAFYGGAWKWLDVELEAAGLPRLGDWFVANTVCCYPLVSHKPEQEHIDACRPNLRAQIQLCDPTWVVLLGATALASTGIVKAKMSEVHGRLFRAPAGPYIDRWCFPTFHPAATFQDPHVIPKIQSDLSTLSRIIHGTLSPEDVLVRIGRGGKVRSK